MRENAYISIQSTSLHTPHAVVYIKSPKKPKYTKGNKLLFKSLQNHGELDSFKNGRGNFHFIFYVRKMEHGNWKFFAQFFLNQTRNFRKKLKITAH